MFTILDSIVDKFISSKLTPPLHTCAFSKSFVWEIIDYLYNKDIAFDVFTNGQSIIKDVERLANYYPRLVGVSIYSGIAEVHDYITRVNGSWERSMQVVRQLSSLAVPLNLKCCVMQPNVKSYFDDAEECQAFINTS